MPSLGHSELKKFLIFQQHKYNANNTFVVFLALCVVDV